MEDNEPERPVFTFEQVLCIFGLLALVAMIAVPNVVQARKHGHEASAIGALKQISTVQSAFREGDKEQDGNLDYGMLSELARVGLVDERLGSGTKQGYLFQVSYGFLTSEFLWFAVANPEHTWSGDRYFTTNQAGVIFYTSGAALVLDTNSCLLPPNAPLPTGGK